MTEYDIRRVCILSLHWKSRKLFNKYAIVRVHILFCQVGAKTSVSAQFLNTALLKKHKTFPWSHYTGLSFHTAQVGALGPHRGPFNGFMRKGDHTFQARGLVTEINSAVSNTVDAWKSWLSVYIFINERVLHVTSNGLRI